MCHTLNQAGVIRTGIERFRIGFQVLQQFTHFRRCEFIMHQPGDGFKNIAAVFSPTPGHVYLLVPAQQRFSPAQVSHFCHDLFELFQFLTHIVCFPF
ncbi:MAG: hypothetical protein ACD_34C00454G0002 [uncultured bacterium]|nr:MAG: hypothetical protein ACD_34C00454G0002 [uncultured bacterium]